MKCYINSAKFWVSAEHLNTESTNNNVFKIWVNDIVIEPNMRVEIDCSSDWTLLFGMFI